MDKAVPQLTMDKFAAWKDLHFDAIFHGDDWRGSAMYTEVEEKLRTVGVDMVFLPHTKGTSSTMLKDALQKVLEGK